MFSFRKWRDEGRFMAGGWERTYLVVADPTRSENTICLAITPAMKALGIRNRCRNAVTSSCRSRRTEGTMR